MNTSSVKIVPGAEIHFAPVADPQPQGATPETDKNEFVAWESPGHEHSDFLCVMADFARTLERQRNIERARADAAEEDRDMFERSSSENFSRAEAERAARHDDELRWRTWCTIEVMVRNPQVAETVKHWENRATVAEAKAEELTRSVQCSAIEGEEVGNPCTLYKDMERRLEVERAARKEAEQKVAEKSVRVQELSVTSGCRLARAEADEAKLAEAKVRIAELQESIKSQKQMLVEGDARISLLESDMRSGTYETLYAQTLAELQDAKRVAEQYKANAERWKRMAELQYLWVCKAAHDVSNYPVTGALDALFTSDNWERELDANNAGVLSSIDTARGKP